MTVPVDGRNFRDTAPLTPRWKFMSTHDESIYTTAASDPNRSQASHHSQTPYNYSPQYTQYPQQPPRTGSGCSGFFLGGCMAFIVCFVGGFLLLSLLVGGLAQMAAVGDFASVAQEDSPSEKFVSGNRMSSNKIAILTIDGLITGSEDGFVAKQIRQILKDDNVKAVVLRVDSPGGTMSGSDYYHYLLKKMKKERNDLPIVVSMGSIAASGGYYVSMVGDEIYAERSTITGSIGVIVPMFKAVELAKKIGIESTPITSGPLKGMGNMTQPMSDEEKAVWKKLIDDNFDRFKEVIREGREVFAKDPQSLDKLATGQIYTATEAEANHLIDHVGFLDDAVAAALVRAGLDEKSAKVIKYRPKLKFMDVLLEARSPDKIFETKTLLDLTTPRLYLLCPHVLPIQEQER